ncbi:hypothetical protein [Atribacter laminatus]|uniref:Uncharacterized protein n=1 Tax=Atribacter laminatus TaxID=2847778 RepID=A0A7T1F2U6_ATRLM|nr:hypothetical protein [Atribacter laminatus]QPM67705.1 hypothetical protein RT761_00917 [Atribacter laminatus]
MKGKLLFILILAVLALNIMTTGCARGDQPSWGEIGKTLTVRGVMKGLASSQYIYYFVFDTDGNILTGPKADPNTWDKYYVARYDGGNFYLKKPDGTQIFINDANTIDTTVTMTINLEELNSPNSIEFMAVTTDIQGNVLDSLSNYRVLKIQYQRFFSFTDTTGETSEAGADISRVEVEVQF